MTPDGPAIFFVLMMLIGHEKPVYFEYNLPTMTECRFEAQEILAKPPEMILLNGGRIHAGCARDYPASKEN